MRNLNGTPTVTEEGALAFGSLPLWFIGGNAGATQAEASARLLEQTGQVTKGSSQILSWGNNAKGHLIKHADVLGFGGHTPQQLQKMLPQLRGAANQLYNNVNPTLTRLGRWGGQTDDVLMYITNNGKMLITKQNGEFITVINKTSNNWYQLAKPIK
ncbi:hypothetical protein [Flavobacterium sp. WV_118_3]|uniref:hypothetical protein n=1 Tax=Flavobacterium sp. WV_118_3 TaxID=3151764 RepID=UPI0012C537F3|nr:hypothetical protein [Flavobacterium sp.]